MGGSALYSDSLSPSLIIATIVDTTIVAKENEVLYKYPYFNKLGLDPNSKERVSYFRVPFQENVSKNSDLKYNYNIFLQI